MLFRVGAGEWGGAWTAGEFFFFLLYMVNGALSPSRKSKSGKETESGEKKQVNSRGEKAKLNKKKIPWIETPSWNTMETREPNKRNTLPEAPPFSMPHFGFISPYQKWNEEGKTWMNPRITNIIAFIWRPPVRAIVASEFRKNAREETERAREKREERNPFDIFRSHKTPHKKHVESITFGDIYLMLTPKSETWNDEEINRNEWMNHRKSLPLRSSLCIRGMWGWDGRWNHTYQVSNRNH